MLHLKNSASIIQVFKKYNRNVEKCIVSLFKQNKKSYCYKAKYDLDLTVNNVSLTNYIENVKKEYEELCQNAETNNRWLEIQPVVNILDRRKSIVDNIISVEELLKEEDDDIRKLAEEEKLLFENKLKEIDKQLLVTLFPTDKNDCFDSVVLEVQAGVGGQEAMLFAKELFDMYCNFCEYKGWHYDISEYLTTDIGGIRYATALVNGSTAFKYFKHEVGVHRVQRTPATEKSGRIHTSTVSVICMPQPTDIQININPKDLRIETKRSSGAGGQHVNTTDSCVRITHLPTSISVECQVDRSQIKNRKMAMAKLNALLYQKELDAQMTETAATRKSQVRSNFRNEKIRTYNFNQDRITDHRLQGCNVHNLRGFLVGGDALEELIHQLDHQNKIDNLLSIVNDSNK